MPSDQSSWYVKASFGAEWGPMSVETLLQMADEGSFAGDDAARCGVDSSWQPITAVLERLRAKEQPARSHEMEDVATEPLSEIVSEVIPEPSDVADHSVTKPARRSSLPGWSTYWTPDSNDVAPSPTKPQFALTAESSANAVGIFAATAEALVDEEPANSNDTFTEAESAATGIHDVDSDNRFDELNAWKRERTERLNRLLKIVADREAAAAREAEAAKAAAAETSPDPNNSEQDPILESETEGSASTPAAAEPQASPRATAKRQENWEETLARWRRSIPDWRFALPMLLLPWLIWNYWPVSQGNIAETYRSMYSELRRRRDLPQDKTGMEEFVVRSQATLDEFIPKLKRGATSKDPDTQLLLWIGRDCLKPLLKNPRLRETKHEQMLKKLLAQWDHTHHIEPAVESPESSTEPLPVSSSATPLGFGKSDEPAESIDAELPPPSSKTKSKPQPVENDDTN